MWISFRIFFSYRNPHLTKKWPGFRKIRYRYIDTGLDILFVILIDVFCISVCTVCNLKLIYKNMCKGYRIANPSHANMTMVYKWRQGYSMQVHLTASIPELSDVLVPELVPCHRMEWQGTNAGWCPAHLPHYPHLQVPKHLAVCSVFLEVPASL